MKQIFNNLRIRDKFGVLLGIVVIGILVFGALAYTTISLVEINGPLYGQIIDGKDLTADILPPPEYLIESFLLTHQMLLETDPSRQQHLIDRIGELKKDFETRHGYWERTLPEGEMKRILLTEAYEPAVQYFDVFDTRYVPALRRGDRRSAQALLQSTLGDAYKQHRAAIDRVVSLSASWSSATEANAADIVVSRTGVLITTAVFLVLAVVVVSCYIAQTINKPVQQLIVNIKNADLNSQLASIRKDEIGDLQRAFDEFVNTVRGTLIQVAESAAAVASASGQISASTEELATGAQEQSHQTTEVSSAVEEMSSTIVENSRNAGYAADTARKSKAAAELGGSVVQESIDGMKRIASVVNTSAETVRKLGKSGDQIGDIIGVIDDIADQTNLLALNAAIEAARAGEQGRGFAVVADEVRKLAERTTHATKEIAHMIRQIQGETRGAVESMEEGTRKVEEGIRLVDKAGGSLQEIVGISQRVTGMVEQIAVASEQQSNASQAITRNLEAITTVTGQTSQATQQIARAAEDLNRLTENLQHLVSQFRLHSGTPHARMAIAASGALVPHD